MASDKDKPDSPALGDRISAIEKRLTSLEQGLDSIKNDHGQDLENIVVLLNKIQDRLIGTIEDKDKIGLIAEVRQLKNEQAADHQYRSTLESQLKNYDQLVKDVEILKESNAQNSRIKWMGYGAAVVIGWLISHFKSLFLLNK